MKVSLLNGLPEEQKREVRAEFDGSPRLRRQIVKVINERIEANRREQCDMKDFDCPNWQYKQAAYIAKEKTLQEVLDILAD